MAVVGAPLGAYVGVKVALKGLDIRVTRIELEIGDHEKGIRGQLHSHHNWLGRHRARILRLEEKAGLNPWEDVGK